jgi:fused signal recognition particle receptor
MSNIVEKKQPVYFDEKGAGFMFGRNGIANATPFSENKSGPFFIFARTGTMRAMSDKSKNNASGGGFFSRLKRRLGGDKGLIPSLKLVGRKLDAELAEELETQLLLADVGIEAAERIVDSLKHRLGAKSIEDEAEVRDALQNAVEDLLAEHSQPLVISETGRPFMILMVGVNGSGKTTTIGKLAKMLQDQGYSVMLAAGDTFRAAAVEQLQAWGERNQVPVIAQQAGADPAAVIYDAFEAAKARGIDVLLADTAGRLQNKAGLMAELTKIVRVAKRLDPASPHETMLVLDASLGQNAVNQAIEFHEAIGLTGITMTKLDGGGKGGVLLAIAERLDVPFRFIGVGEGIGDMGVFDAKQFAAALVEPAY